MSDSIRTSEPDKWRVVTRTCFSLETAMDVSQEFLQRTSQVVLWPAAHGRWWVIARLPVLLN